MASTARALGRPVKWTGERGDAFQTDTHGRAMVSNAKLPNIHIVDYWTTDKLFATLETHKRALAPNIQEKIRIFGLPVEVNN